MHMDLSFDVHEMGWAVVINLAATSFNKRSIANESGIKLLVEAGACDGLICTLKNPAFRSELAIFENALWALVNISIDSVGEEKLLQLNRIKLVVGTTWHANSTVQSVCEPFLSRVDCLAYSSLSFFAPLFLETPSADNLSHFRLPAEPPDLVATMSESLRFTWKIRLHLSGYMMGEIRLHGVILLLQA